MTLTLALFYAGIIVGIETILAFAIRANAIKRKGNVIDSVGLFFILQVVWLGLAIAIMGYYAR